MTRPIPVIIGPTAVGKTDLSLAIARDLDAEIIGGDSRQVYRFLDIGTAKPSLAQRHTVPHHLIDILNPDEPLNAAGLRSWPGVACMPSKPTANNRSLLAEVGSIFAL